MLVITEYRIAHSKPSDNKFTVAKGSLVLTNDLTLEPFMNARKAVNVAFSLMKIATEFKFNITNENCSK